MKEVYARLKGEANEAGKPKIVISVRMPPELKDLLTAEAGRRTSATEIRVSVNMLAVELLCDGLLKASLGNEPE